MNNNHRLKEFASLLLSVFCLSSSAQTNVPNFHSPNTEALLKFSEIPVSNYTGVPKISVPLGNYDFSVRNIEISLDYHASGIRDVDMPTWVGLGWSLNVGGSIVRVVEGYPDEYINGSYSSYSQNVKSKLSAAVSGWSNQFNSTDDYEIYNSSSYFNCLDYLGTETVDTQYDIYQYSFNEFAGKFTFDNNGDILKLTHDNLKIEYLSTKNFRITDGDGNIYLFNNQETRYTRLKIGAEIPYVSSWSLSSITNSVTMDKIDFVYKSLTQSQAGFGTFNIHNYSDRMKIFDDGYLSPYPFERLGEPATWQKYILTKFGEHVPPVNDASAVNQYLSKIIYNKDTISFHSHSTSSNLIMRTFLDSITVHSDRERISRIIFLFGNFEGYKITNFLGNPMIEGNSKLSGVQVGDKHYSFNYYETYMGKNLFHNFNHTLGHKVGKDFWGYYNGEDYKPEEPFFKVYNSHGISETGNADLFSYDLQYRNSAFRNPDHKYAQLRTLKSIVYPTGGMAEFEYEGNDYSFVGYSPGAYQATVLNDETMQLRLDSLVSRRISTVTENSGYGSHSEVMEFTIHNDQNITVAQQIGIPPSSNLTLADYNNFVQSNPIGNIGSCRILKFNESTSSFDILIFTKEFDVVTAIGTPVSEGHFQSLLRNAVFAGNSTIFLLEGRYKMESSVVGPQDFQCNLTVSYKFPYRRNTVFNSGGIRIKRIKYTENGRLLMNKTFSYQDDQGNSSGVLEAPLDFISPYIMGMQQPRSGYFNNGNTSGLERALFFKINYSGNSNAPTGGHVGYTKVTEIQEGNGKTIYHYTSGKKPQNNLIPHLGDTYQVRQYISYHIRTNIVQDQSSLRGLLIEREQYDESGEIKSRQYLSYDMSLFSDRTSVSMILPIKPIPSKIYGEVAGNGIEFFGNSQLEREFLFTRAFYPVLKKDSTVNYFGTERSIQVLDYEYSPIFHFNPVSVSTTSSEGVVAKKMYRYANDFSGDATYSKMITDHNMVNTVIEELNYKGNMLVSGKFNSYKDWNGKIVPESVSKKFGTGDYLTEFAIEQYDALFNPVATIRKNGLREIYLWSYNGRHAIAKITNLSYMQVETALGNVNIVNFLQNSKPTFEEIQSFILPLRTMYPRAQIVIYEYQPLVGMKSMTDPRGVTEYYEYDGFQRLKDVLDYDKNLLQDYQYHYRP
ncbi:hypothetical protein FAZ19_10745 [Sphingobacterium alkalisoli]|uniref:RHS repeat protein n=1 Tax=Sphingobacterium alkalisoli TaxID=1874115 RepID=A0A4U0H3C2_9SPHI|nr:hypothetical protein [Sphingobacterium alkalisoli]TJY65604.1 hypothetical protein FAZ19_10745 [Sphingobacterium alkalisoli]